VGLEGLPDTWREDPAPGGHEHERREVVAAVAAAVAQRVEEGAGDGVADDGQGHDPLVLDQAPDVVRVQAGRHRQHQASAAEDRPQCGPLAGAVHERTGGEDDDCFAAGDGSLDRDGR
jgi:hypothetical protein